MYSALHTASCSGEEGAVKAILAHRIDLVNVEQPLKPLYAASIWGCWKVVDCLMSFPGPDPNQKHTGGWTPLTAAADNGFVNTVRVLLDHGADPNLPGPEDKFTALYYAAVIRGHTDIVRMLLARGATINHETLYAPLLCSIVANPNLSVEDKISLSEILIQHDPSIDIDKSASNGYTPLMVAAEKGDTTMIRWLLRHGSDINRMTPRGVHSLFFAVGHRQVAATKELLKHDTPPILDIESEDSRFPLEYTVADEGVQDDGSLVELLLDAGADLEFESKKKQTVFTVAVDCGQLEVVKLLLKRGVDIHHRDMWDYTPILTSIQLETPSGTEITRLLVDNGANLKDAMSDSSTALHLAMWRSDLDKVRILLEFRSSIDIHARDSDGDTPLLCSTGWERPQIVECLKLIVRAGADVNDQNTRGWCLLMKSAWRGEAACAVHDFLLSLPETKVDLVAPDGGYPLQVACRIGYMDLMHKLLDRGTDVNLAVPGLAPTALISACASNTAKTDETTELIVRELVARGAQPDFMSKNNVGIFNALCAASFQAGVGTINFLLDSGASAQQPDPLGRLPIHFAAASGLRNFEAVALTYKGDIMAVDKTDKNVLHWAAQFGNCGTVKAIFERIPASKRKAVVDCKDVDGWTPLAWAMRPNNPDDNTAKGFSEQRDYVGTVQYLIQQGADVGVTFRQGRGEAAEELTPAVLAERCGADDLVRLLTRSERSEQDSTGADAAVVKHTPRSSRYTSRQKMCDMCFSVCIPPRLYLCLSVGQAHSHGP